MAVNYNFKKGIDRPVWDWLAMPPVAVGVGTSNTYDGKRYEYWTITTGLYRFDTWTNSWQYLSAITAVAAGGDLEYDSVRNVLYITTGTSTAWSVFNLNTTAVTIANIACPAWTLTNITVVLPATSGLGASFTMPSDDAVPAIIDTGTADATGQTTTTIVATAATGTFGQGMVNLQLRVLTGAQTGQLRTISAVAAPTTLTVTPALPGALAAGDTYQIELVSDVATATTTTTITDTTANWTVNAYANMDVIVDGQRRRIASNTATVLTLAAATTGNARTGPFSPAPTTQTAAFKIVPSADFLYFQPGGSTTTMFRLDVAQTTGAAWSASLTAAPATIGGGGNTFYPAAYAPYQILAFRGNVSAATYLYNIGTNAWTTITTFAGVETFTTGATSAMIAGKRKLFIQKEGTTRLYILDLLTGVLEPGGTVPYAASTALDGKRTRVVTTADGAQFLYIIRMGGQEFFRVPLEWL